MENNEWCLSCSITFNIHDMPISNQWYPFRSASIAYRLVEAEVLVSIKSILYAINVIPG